MIRFADQFANRAQPSRLVARGKLRPLVRGIFTDDTTSDPEEIVRREWRTIVGHVMPGAVLVGRSGFATAPVDGWLFVAHERQRPLELPGLTVVSTGAGGGPLPGDWPLGDEVWRSSEQRALLDNAKPTRRAGDRPSATLSRAELHTEIAHLVASRRPDQIHRILDAVHTLAAARGDSPNAVDDIDVFFLAAAGDAPTVDSDSPEMRAAQAGKQYDARRVEQFLRLADWLRDRPPAPIALAPQPRRRWLPFFEAYFSNYIEGTEFEVDEAIDIAVNGEIPEGRPADAHDILGTYKIVDDDSEMELRFTDFEAWYQALIRRHSAIMEGRPALAGVIKTQPNKAGGTYFVRPPDVDGTLREGFRILGTLDDPFARAVFTMYFVAEVHPFADGNGRVSRVMMNGELVAAAQPRIIVPTIERQDYVSALSGTSHNDNVQSLVSVLSYLQRWTNQIDFSDLPTARDTLERMNAMEEPARANQIGLRLLTVGELRDQERAADEARHPSSVGFGEDDAAVGWVGGSL